MCIIRKSNQLSWPGGGTKLVNFNAILWQHAGECRARQQSIRICALVILLNIKRCHMYLTIQLTGWLNRDVTCVNSASGVVVDKRRCNGKPKPASHQLCEQGTCNARLFSNFHLFWRRTIQLGLTKSSFFTADWTNVAFENVSRQFEHRLNWINPTWRDATCCHLSLAFRTKGFNCLVS